MIDRSAQGPAAWLLAVIALMPMTAMPVRAAPSASLVQMDIDDIRRAVVYPLPSVTSIVGTDPARMGRPLVVVSDLNETAASCQERAIGQAAGTFLRVSLWGRIPSLSFTHPLGYWVDVRARTAGGDGTPGTRAMQRTGADLALRGSIASVDDSMTLVLELADGTVPVPEVRKVYRTATTRSELATAVLDGATSLLDSLSSDAIAPHGWMGRYDGTATQRGFDRLVAALERSCSEGGYPHEIERAWNDEPRFPAIAALYLLEAESLYDEATFRGVLRTMEDHVEGNPMLEAATGFRRIRLDSRNGDDTRALDEFAHRMSAYVHEPAALYMLADAYSSLERLYANPDGLSGPQYVVAGPVPHHPRFAAGLSLALAGYRAYPGDYRASWSLAYALSRYADSIRGAYSRKPDHALDRLPVLLEQFRQAATRAARSHPGVAGIRELQMTAAALNGLDWWSHFEEAIALSPNDPWLYRLAINYAGQPWGGTPELRARIYRLATANNPGADWPVAVYSAWTDRSEWWPVVYGTRVAAGAVLLAIGLVLLVAVHRRYR
jgi:hypothetical protein